MKIKLSCLLAGVALSVHSMVSMAATIDITAEFAPSLTNPHNNTFKNTTPLSGYCLTYPAQCQEQKTFSITMGDITLSLVSDGFKANSEPRMGMYFKMPSSWRDVKVTSADGKDYIVKFRVNAFSSQYNTKTSWLLEGDHDAWGYGRFVNPPQNCGYSGVGRYTDRSYLFMWKWPEGDVACYKTAKKDFVGEPHLINNTSIGYEIIAPNPLQMESGSYKGSQNFTVGPGGDFDFGDNLAPSDSLLTINFTLTVNHELKLSATTKDKNITLQPCAEGRVCTEEEGQANWERWMTTLITPQKTGRSHFLLSSSGAFTVYLQCEQQLGADCALKSDNAPSSRVPVQTMLTLPENVIDMTTGSTVVKRRLAAGKDLNKNLFATREFGQDRGGSLDFLIAQNDVDTMLQTRPDTYRGAVTVFFDPQIF